MLKLKIISQFINKLLKRKTKSKHKTLHYIKPTTLGIWNHFRVIIVFSLLSFSSIQAASVNWEVSNVQNPNNRAIYGLVGDTAFRQQVLDSLSNSTFSQLMASNPDSFKGVLTANSSGYVKSPDFNVNPSIKKMSMFVVILNGNNSGNYIYADITDIVTKARLDQKNPNTFSFDAGTGFTRIDNNNVPEPDITIMMILGMLCIIVCYRPAAIKNHQKSVKYQ